MKQHRVKNESVSGKQIADWLDHALNGNDPKPTPQLCEKLASCISPVLEYADVLSARTAEETASKRSRGRPVSAWHGPARDIAATIKHIMQNAGYKRRLRSADEGSVVAIVGSKIISYAYGIVLRPRGFAQAMNIRDRRSKGTREHDFYLRYPDARRIRIQS